MKIEPPPLPEPAIIGDDVLDGYLDPDAEFTADQLRERDAYWMARLEEAVRQERERCALVCEELMHADIGGTPTVEWRKARYSGLYEAAAAIREQK